MTPTATQTIDGTYTEDGIHSAFGFAVAHNGISTYRGTLDAVSATLSAGEDGIELRGAARVESISIREPEQFRAHVLGEEFFNATAYPEVSFSSTSVELADDGSAAVEGELTIAGTTRPVSAKGSWRGPVEGPDTATRLALELETGFDRREFGFDWQMELPGGGEALAWNVALEIHLELVQGAPEA